MENPLCGMCGEMGETAQHIICKYKKLTQGEYKRRHDAVAKLVHWKLCEKHNLERKEKGTSIALKELWKMMMLN